MVEDHRPRLSCGAALRRDEEEAGVSLSGRVEDANDGRPQVGTRMKVLVRRALRPCARRRGEYDDGKKQ